MVFNMYSMVKPGEYQQREQEFFRYLDLTPAKYYHYEYQLHNNYLALLSYFEPRDVAITFCKDLVKFQLGLNLDKASEAYEYYVREVYGYDGEVN